MRIIIAFFKGRKREICFYAVFTGIFVLVSYLYNVRMDAVRYALLLSAVWLLLFGALDYVKYSRRHKELLDIEKRLESGIEDMPDSETLIEEDYQRILAKLYERKIEMESESRIVRQEMVDYYSMWVHQIKTPIAAMHVLLQALDGCQYDGCRWSCRQYTKEMKLELFKTEQYAEVALSYLRMEDMSSDLSFEVCSLDSVIKQAVRKYSQMFILKKIRLEYTPIETKVLSDEKWLVFVLEQLLSNALKYTIPDEARQPDGACITGCPDGDTRCKSVSVYMEDCVLEEDVYENTEEIGGIKNPKFPENPRKKESCLVIEDNGIGIRPEDLPRIFEKGFTGYNGRTDKKSTGIGLYLCKSVIDKLRHQIWIKSEVGKGTKVYLFLGRKMIRHE